MRSVLFLYIASLLVLLSFKDLGAQPANDLCEDATDISSDIGSNYCGDDNSATNDGDDGNVTSCWDEDSEVWYSFSGVQTIKITVTDWCGTTYEPNVTVYEGSCGGGLTELACDDYSGDSTVQVGGLNSSNTYYISVDNDDCSGGSFCFDISEYQPPPNDTCEGAIDISSSIGGTVCASDTNASNDPDDGDVTTCDDEDSEVWHSFTGEDAIEISLDSWCGSTYEPNISLYEGSCGGGLTELACEATGDPIEMSGLDPAQTYYISIGNDNSACSGGDACFNISEFIPPPNDTCEGAIDISSSFGGVYCAEDTNASNDPDDGNVTSCDDEDSEVWHSFTGKETVEIAIDNWCGSTYEPNISLYSGSCGGGLTEIVCDDFGDTISAAGLDPTKTYYISIDNDVTACDEGQACFYIDEFQPPPNDTCEGAIDISSSFGGTFCAKDTNATNDPDDGDVTSCDDENSEVWHSFTGKQTVEIAVDNWCGSTYEPNISLYSGSCGGNLTEILCDDLGDTISASGLDPSKTYYLSVDNDASACNEGEACFYIDEFQPPPNDTCEGAIDISSSFGGIYCAEDTSASNDVDDGDVTSCDDENSEVWHSFTGKETVEIAIDNWCDGAGDYSEPNISLYSGSCGGGLTEIICDDLGDTIAASGLDPTETYYISVDNDATDCEEGDACFYIDDFVPPPNDTCEGAIDISSSFGGTFCASDTSASNDVDDGDMTSCDDENSEVWHSFTGKEAVEIAVDSWCGSTYEPNVSLYSGTCGGGLNEMICDDLGDTIATSGLDPTKTYYISIDNDESACEGGEACFYIDDFVPPPNDTCEGAIDISSDIGGNVCGEDTSASNDPDDGDVTSCDDEDSEVWYSFTGEDGIKLVNTSFCGSTYEPNFSLYEGSCGGGLTELDCDATGDTVFASGLDPAKTYYISVDSDASACDGGSFCFDIDTLDWTSECLSDPKAIDKCGTNFSINTGGKHECGYECCGTSSNSNYDDVCGSSTCGACSDGCDMDGSTENNVFWSFVPTETCDYEVTLDIYNCGGSGSQYGIYEYVSGEFVTYYAQDGTGVTGTYTETFTATAGNEVVIMVDGYGGDVCDVDVSVATVNCSDCTLPLELLRFEGQAIERGNRLSWKGRHAHQKSHYIVQRSKKGKEFERFDRVEAKEGNDPANRYAAVDLDPYAGKTFYRLKKVGPDGGSDHSRIVTVERAEKPFSFGDIYPNPSTGRLNVTLQNAPAGNVELVVHDRTGRVVAKREKELEDGLNELKLNLSSLSPGFYMLELKRKGKGSGETIEPFTIQK